MLTASATEVQNNFSKYLQYAIDNGEVVIFRNGKRVARIVSDQQAITNLTDSLRGVLKHDYDEREMQCERMNKHAGVD